jgi:hypothetical protein
MVGVGLNTGVTMTCRNKQRLGFVSESRFRFGREARGVNFTISYGGIYPRAMRPNLKRESETNQDVVYFGLPSCNYCLAFLQRLPRRLTANCRRLVFLQATLQITRPENSPSPTASFQSMRPRPQ